MAEPIGVLLVDDHSLVRKGFRRLLEDDPGITVVGEASNGREAIQQARELKPRVVVMDMSMPELDGALATTEILRFAPETAILILSMYSQENYVRNAFQAGARGYMLKNAVDVDLVRAVKDLAANKSVVGPGVLVAPRPAGNEEDKLTPRERQVLALIAQGKSNKDIAHLLGLSVNTVAVHRANIMDALGLHRTAELVVYAVGKGMVNLP